MQLLAPQVLLQLLLLFLLLKLLRVPAVPDPAHLHQ